jgi:hypothetical protein
VAGHDGSGAGVPHNSPWSAGDGNGAVDAGSSPRVGPAPPVLVPTPRPPPPPTPAPHPSGSPTLPGAQRQNPIERARSALESASKVRSHAKVSRLSRRSYVCTILYFF